jgi:small-conductance mechanosensitive channel
MDMPEPSPLIRRLSVPAVLTAALALLYLFRHVLNPAWMSPPHQTYLLAALVVSLGVLLLRLVSFILFDLLFRRRKGREAPQLIRMVVSVISYAAIFVAVWSWVFDRSLSGILATSAVLTVILGLALQDTLGNFFAGISLHIEQPYHIGDALQVGNVVGSVESVTWRTTTIHTNNNSQVIFPNSRMARDQIEVFSLDSLNRRILRFPAPYDIAPEKIIQMAAGIAASVPKVSAERPPSVRIGEFTDSSITYEILFWITDYLWAHEIEAVMRERLWYALRRLDIEIPFPVRHVLFERRKPAKQDLVPDCTKFLADVEILKPLRPDELTAVAGSVLRHIYAPGETVIQTGDPGTSMFVIHNGQAEVLARDASGRQGQIAVMGAGNVIGEMGLFTGEPRRADVRALEELELLEIRKPVMQNLLSANQSLADAFSLIIAGRQAELTRFSESASGEEKVQHSRTILQRIKRFFALS